MTQPARQVALTVAEYRLLPEGDGKRWELVDGGLTVTPSPTPRHQLISTGLLVELTLQLARSGRAVVMPAPIDVVLDDTNVVQPDLVIVAAHRTAIITERAVEGAPDIVVEVLSPSTAGVDRHLKHALYARFGVREYWIVDPKLGFVEAYRLGERGYELRARYDRASTLTCPEFEGLRIELAPIFA